MSKDTGSSPDKVYSSDEDFDPDFEFLNQTPSPKEVLDQAKSELSASYLQGLTGRADNYIDSKGELAGPHPIEVHNSMDLPTFLYGMLSHSSLVRSEPSDDQRALKCCKLVEQALVWEQAHEAERNEAVAMHPMTQKEGKSWSDFARNYKLKKSSPAKDNGIT